LAAAILALLLSTRWHGGILCSSAGAFISVAVLVFLFSLPWIKTVFHGFVHHVKIDRSFVCISDTAQHVHTLLS
jgi:hypothetical protein